MSDQVVIHIGANATKALAAFGAVAGAAASLGNRLLNVAINGARAFAMLIPNAVKFADEMYEASQRAGVNVTSFSSLAYAAKLAGVSVEDLTTAAKFAAQNGYSLDEMIVKTADDFARLTSETEKLNMVRERFGKGGQSLLPLLNQGSEEIRKQTRYAKELGVAISENLGKAADQFGDTLDTIRTRMTGITIEVAERLLPSMQALADKMLEMMQSQGFVSSMESIANSMLSVANAALKLADSPLFKRVTEAFEIYSSYVEGVALVLTNTGDREKLNSANPLDWISVINDAFKKGSEPIIDAAFRIAARDGESDQAVSSPSENVLPSGKIPFRMKPGTKTELRLSDQRIESNWTSRGFIAFGEMQMLNRTFSFQKSVQASLAEIVGLQKTYLPRMAETLS